MRENEQEQRQVFIGNLAFDATEKELADALDFAGIQVFRVRIATNKDNGQSRGFAFIDIDRDEVKGVDEIIDIINAGGIELYNRAIRADHAHVKPRPERSTAGPSRARKPQGGRGRRGNEFQRGRNEFEVD